MAVLTQLLLNMLLQGLRKPIASNFVLKEGGKKVHKYSTGAEAVMGTGVGLVWKLVVCQAQGAYREGRIRCNIIGSCRLAC